MLLPGSEYGFKTVFQRETMTTMCSFLVPGLFLGYPYMWHLVMGPFAPASTIPARHPPQSTRAATSKQNSWPRMELCTGLMMESSSKLSSKASAALLGLSKDSWEWDSLKLCISRALVGRRFRERSGQERSPLTLRTLPHQRFWKAALERRPQSFTHRLAEGRPNSLGKDKKQSPSTDFSTSTHT